MTALAGLRVLDFSRFLPGGYVGWIAGDLGAEVIRVEHPREIAKRVAMMGAEDTATRARSSYGRNKRSLAINPASAAARPVLLDLIARADVLVEDYRPGAMAAMGWGAAAMIEHNPRLVYCSVSFAGQVGPLADSVGHDPAALALAGALSRLNGTPTPTLPGVQVADVLAGAHATIAVLAALRSRDATGRGQHVDVAMTDASLPLLMVALERAADPATLGAPSGAWHPKGGVWACADGEWLVTTDMEPAYWARFCAAIGRPDFEPLRTRPETHAATADELRALFLTRSRDQWLALLREAGAQVAPVLSPAEAIADPHHRARGAVVDVVTPQGMVAQIGTPFRLADTPPVAPRAGGAAGADTDAILAELGLDAAAVAALAAAGAFSGERG